MANKRIVDLSVVPDWRFVPVELITPATAASVNTIELVHDSSSIAPVSQEVRELVTRYLRPCEKEGVFFNGPYFNVEGIEVRQDLLTLYTGLARAFPYIASAWHYRHDPSINPIHPLAVQTVVTNLAMDKILVERRPADITDHPRKLSVLGGALDPAKDVGLKEAATRCLKKWRIEVAPEDLFELALSHEPADRIYCVSYGAILPDDVIQHAIEELSGKRDMQLLPCADWDHVCAMLLTDQPNGHSIYDWNPLGFMAFLVGAAWYCGVADENNERLSGLIRHVYSQLRHKPFEYRFPMQGYLPTELEDA